MLAIPKMRSSTCLPWLIGLVSFAYLAVLCVKSYSGVFNSTDSADFLAASKVWMVVQTYGYPLYILLGHLVNLLPGNLAANMTILLTALPAAITVVLVYLVVHRLTNKAIIATVSSVTLLSTIVFLTEATVTKGYSLAAMFLVLSYYCYICEWKYRTVIFLGLATAVHATMGIIAVLWLLADRRWDLWLGKPLIVYVLVGILPYLLIPILMALDTPRYLAGDLSLANLKGYWGGTGRAIVGMLSVFDAPERWWFLFRVLLVSIGLTFVPLIQAVRQLRRKYVAVLVAVPVFMLWYVGTCLDMQVWTYLSMSAPFIAILVGVGLAKMEKYHTYAIAAAAIVLVVVNSCFMNANRLTDQNPYMQEYKASLEALPDGAVMVVTPGSFSLGLFYTIVEGKNLIPLVYSYLELDTTMGMKGYDKYLLEHYGVTWTSTLDGVQQCLDANRPVYFMPVLGSQVLDCFILETPLRYNVVTRITGLTGLEPLDTIEVKYW